VATLVLHIEAKRNEGVRPRQLDLEIAKAEMDRRTARALDARRQSPRITSYQPFKLSAIGEKMYRRLTRNPRRRWLWMAPSPVRSF